MLEVDNKALITHLDRAATTALESAAGRCVSRGHYEVTIEHLIDALLDAPDGQFGLLLHHYGVDAGTLRAEISRSLDRNRSGNPQRPVFSPLLFEALQQAWLIASLETGATRIGTGAILAAIVANPGRWCDGDHGAVFARIDRADLTRRLVSMEVAQAGPDGKSQTGPSQKGSGPGGAIATYCIDFTAKARAGGMDPVFGRDREIRQIIDILARRRKNNPICVGEPGVGKTAVVEGLALRIVEDDVPMSLRGVSLIGLDLGLLQAGASVKGEFENRLKQVLQEVTASPTGIVLFIDEAHTLIGAGGSAGTGDAANLLKPALARGELRTIAATTWSEYKKYFEKDAALARRFQVVKLDEPSIAVTIAMLRGLRERYERAHDVIIRDDALEAAAQMGSRYISGRQQPDKGIDLIDTAAARVKVALTCRPPELQDLDATIAELERSRIGLERDQATGAVVDAKRIAGVITELAEMRARTAALEQRWTAERTAAESVISARRALMDADAAASPVISTPGTGAAGVTTSQPPGTPVADRKTLRGALDTATAALAVLRKGTPLVHHEVTPEVIAGVVADWTGIPVGSMVRDQAQALMRFEAVLGERIKGQDHVLSTIGEGIRAAKAGLRDPRTPMGVFLLVGPSGVGKTETATGVADLVFGGERFMTVVNMSEFQEKHSVARLIGSPPGYVGYGEGGVLTEAVRQRPYSVVLLDEVEKADPEVLNLFYQVFDKGMLSDGEGRVIDFKDTVIFLTSNLASDIIMEACSGTTKPDVASLISAIRPVLSHHFKPALLGRMTIVPFHPIASEALKDIARLKLDRLRRRLVDSQGISLVIDSAVIDAIAARCTEVDSGARNVDAIISGNLMPLLSTEVLKAVSSGVALENLTVGLDANGGFVLHRGTASSKAGKGSRSSKGA